MVWFRAGSNVTKLAVRRILNQGTSYATRTRSLPSQTRSFHSSLYRPNPQSTTAPIPRAVPLSKLTDSFLDGTSSMVWFRAGSNVTKLAVRRILNQGNSYATRTRSLPSQTRSFHSSLYRPNPQSTTAPIPRAVPLSKLTDSFLDGTSSVYLEELQRAWEADPTSVDESWDNFFRNFVGQAATSPGISGQTIQESMNLLLLVRAYQVNGHMKANLDPLGLEQREIPEDLDLALYGFTEADLDREFFLGVWQMSGFMSENRPVQTLRSILARLQQAYCGSIGFEYMHIADRDKCNWLREKIETPTPWRYNRERREVILDRLAWSTQFENFLATKWTTAKRFGLEGGESLIPGMKEMFDRAADLGVESIVIGMSHRGRLNVLGNVVRKPLRQIFSEFSGGIRPVDEVGYTGTGDVKYHLGTSYDRPTRGGKKIHLSLVANPSHLEAADSVVVGKTRAKQYYSKDMDRTKNLGILIHGDGSFAGQGVVYETLHLSALPNYTTGGTIHIVVNNQVAFTTDPRAGRSSQYCTDVAKALSAPIFHVNGDDVEAVVHACELAAEWRQTFHSDVVVDLGPEHSSARLERYLQMSDDNPYVIPDMEPTMRKQIQECNWQIVNATTPANYFHVLRRQIHRDFRKPLIVMAPKNLLRHKDCKSNLSEFDDVQGHPGFDKQGTRFKRLIKDQNDHSDLEEGIRRLVLCSGKVYYELDDERKKVGASDVAICRVEQLCPFPYDLIQRELKRYPNAEIVWCQEEAMNMGAFSYITPRLWTAMRSLGRGDMEDIKYVGRGPSAATATGFYTFHETGEEYCPLDHLVMNQDPEMFTVSNSSLSEFGVLGFELGYSMESPNSLVLWEAQFGDFANGAQVIFDQFISSGEAKWLRQTGLVVLLPHGYDGQGPEHSSARLERYLQMSDDNPYVIPDMEPTMRKQIQECNWQIVNATTPANYFHVLRRQIHRDFRKPLIVMAPKNLLRHKDCKSNLSEFDDVQGHPGFDKQGTRFKRLIKDQNDHSDLEEGIRRLVLCSGKVYYELDDERKKVGASDVAICRVEQLCPFPYDLIQRELKRYPNAEIVWCQEEAMNMGAFSYITPRLWTAMRSLGRGDMEDIKYVGRGPSAATATGFYTFHVKEQAELVQKAIGKEPIR
ncbi:hypothetical protein F2Q70_00002283 [Brassica cretica]|uniref:2-oxoglutarate dehydrogenase, mitochondrial n=1 Tax=Brassica cretica TaxID=69181 RepID=A0A8S9IMW7_BRACR|nr:hypothetical protein F2Q70_00002283 [Brassica cretica]